MKRIMVAALTLLTLAPHTGHTRAYMPDTATLNAPVNVCQTVQKRYGLIQQNIARQLAGSGPDDIIGNARRMQVNQSLNTGDWPDFLENAGFRNEARRVRTELLALYDLELRHGCYKKHTDANNL